jgi:hypothetical protein
VVILVPLAALLAIAFVVLPLWRPVLRWPTAAGAVVSGASAWVAVASGQSLLVRVSQVRATTTNFALVQTHVDRGYVVRIVATIFMVLVIAAVLVLAAPGQDTPRRRPLENLLAVLVVLASVAVIVTVVQAGHAGSAAVWSDLA